MDIYKQTRLDLIDIRTAEDLEDDPSVYSIISEEFIDFNQPNPDFNPEESEEEEVDSGLVAQMPPDMTLMDTDYMDIQQKKYIRPGTSIILDQKIFRITCEHEWKIGSGNINNV